MEVGESKTEKPSLHMKYNLKGSDEASHAIEPYAADHPHFSKVSERVHHAGLP